MLVSLLGDFYRRLSARTGTLKVVTLQQERVQHYFIMRYIMARSILILAQIIIKSGYLVIYQEK